MKRLVIMISIILMMDLMLTEADGNYEISLYTLTPLFTNPDKPNSRL